jgi:TadE-like protein
MGRKRTSAGIAMTEFAIVTPMLFFILVGSVDFMRLIQANSTVADASRQGARQAVANSTAADNPYGASNSQPCSGTTFTPSASGRGCLTDARIEETVAKFLAPLTTTVTLYSNKLASACPTPAPAQANLCIAPAESGSAGAYADCPSAKTALGHDPQPGDLGARKQEWLFPKYKGCFLVQVTVVYTFQPYTPFGPILSLKSSTAMLGEEY